MLHVITSDETNGRFYFECDCGRAVSSDDEYQAAIRIEEHISDNDSIIYNNL